ncbi:hypothetical protein [Streptomyces sp. LUP30]|uniref:hypothetical protein n=1 Tax=Streptomyces sp. LUP30 TaxID=1890285 RepID=UPI000851B968|nr:hypothetical protein [Streptomyces sp. LUP30]
MTGEQLALTWSEPCNTPSPANRPPTRFDLRQHEMWDIRGQRIEPAAYWTAHTITVKGDLL